MILADLYVLARSDRGVNIPELKAAIESVLFNRSQADIEDYRIGKSCWKKLKDEIVPIVDLLRQLELHDVKVSFPLDCGVEDGWLCINETWLGMQITASLGTENIATGMDLNQNGEAAGFVGLQNSPLRNHRRARRKNRVAYSTEYALEVIHKGILKCLDAKDEAKFKGMVLIVTANLTALPANRWSRIVAPLKERATTLPFAYVYVSDVGGERQNPLKLKGDLTADTKEWCP